MRSTRRPHDPSIDGAQLGLFAGASPPAADGEAARADAMREAWSAIAARLPRGIRLGPSSWSFPGWGDAVWPRDGRWSADRCAREGLSVVARHPLIGTVGLDRSFYAPLSRVVLAAYAEQLPDGFPLVCKVWEGITVERGLAALARGRAPESDAPNAADAPDRAASFLSFDALEATTLAPHREAFAANTGALVLELAAGQRLDVEATAARLGGMLRRAVDRAAGMPIVVEARDKRWFAGSGGVRFGRALAESGAGLCLGWHPSMPTIAEQLAFADRHGLLEGGSARWVARIMLPPGTTYEARKRSLAPFDRIVERDEVMRAAVIDVVGRAVRAGRELLVTINNKAEGSAPLTVFELAERIAKGG